MTCGSALYCIPHVLLMAMRFLSRQGTLCNGIPSEQMELLCSSWWKDVNATLCRNCALVFFETGKHRGNFERGVTLSHTWAIDRPHHGALRKTHTEIQTLVDYGWDFDMVPSWINIRSLPPGMLQTLYFPKTNSSPLKISRTPKRQNHLRTTIFEGVLLGVQCHINWFGFCRTKCWVL